MFAYAERSTLSYPLETLVRMAEAVPTIRAIKDWSNDAMLHERQIRTLQSLPRPVNVLTTHSAWLMSSLVLGCNGLLSGSGSVIPDLQAALWQAVQANDLARARAINDRIYPLAQAFYAAPALDMHNRMKECLVMLGRMERAVVRPPLVRIERRRAGAAARGAAAGGDRRGGGVGAGGLTPRSLRCRRLARRAISARAADGGERPLRIEQRCEPRVVHEIRIVQRDQFGPGRGNDGIQPPNARQRRRVVNRRAQDLVWQNSPAGRPRRRSALSCRFPAAAPPGTGGRAGGRRSEWRRGRA